MDSAKHGNAEEIKALGPDCSHKRQTERSCSRQGRSGDSLRRTLQVEQQRTIQLTADPDSAFGTAHACLALKVLSPDCSHAVQAEALQQTRKELMQLESGLQGQQQSMDQLAAERDACKSGAHEAADRSKVRLILDALQRNLRSVNCTIAPC